MKDKTFVTVINCMDGRVQVNVNEYMKKTYDCTYVDTITMAGPCEVIADLKHESLIENLKYRVNISVNNHLSKIIAIVGHVDCTAIDAPDEEQMRMVRDSVDIVKKWAPGIQVVGLWVDDTWTAKEIY